MPCRRVVTTCCLLSTLAPLAGAGALPGLPAVPRPGPLPVAWAGLANDALAGEIGTNPDDLRTSAISAGVQPLAGWFVAGDLSSLTNRGNHGQAPSRSDELTLCLTRTVAESRDQGAYRHLYAGGAFRFAGDFGGQDLQNWWHDIFGFEDVDLPYETAREQGFLVLGGQWLAHWDAPWATADGAPGRGMRPGLVADGGLMLGVLGETLGQAGVRGVLLGHDGGLWLGARYAYRQGDPLSTTGEVVSQAEEGPWLVYGAAVGWLSFEAGVHLEDGLAAGRAIVTVGREPIHDQRGDDLLQAEVGGTLDTYGIGLQLRWQPAWLTGLGEVGRRASLLADYRYGKVDEVDLADGSVRCQQGVLGLDLALLPPRAGVSLTPFAAVAAGMRQEELRADDPQPDDDTCSRLSPVVQGGLGLRCAWGDLPGAGNSGLRYGLVLAEDWWWATHEAEVLHDGQSVRYLRPGQSTSLRLLMELAW